MRSTSAIATTPAPAGLMRRRTAGEAVAARERQGEGTLTVPAPLGSRESPKERAEETILNPSSQTWSDREWREWNQGWDQPRRR